MVREIRSRMLWLCFLLLFFVPAGQGQEAVSTQAAAPAAAGGAVSLDQLERIQADLAAGQERLSNMLQGMDMVAAEAWIAESPLERLRQRAADTVLDEAERAEWQKAAEQEQADVERVRAAISRAELALAAKDRLRAAEGRVEAMRATLAAPLVDQQRPLSQIEQEIATLTSLRLQVGLELNQNRQTLTRLEEGLRTQAETLDNLRREREQELATAAARNGQAEAPADLAATLPERRTEASVISAQLDSQSRPPRIERQRLEIRVQELEDRRLGERLSTLQAEYNLRSTAELRALNAALKGLLEREPRMRELYAEQVNELYRQMDRIAVAQGRIRALQLEREDSQRIENNLKQVLTNVRERVAVGGLSETLGSLFLEEQRRLRSLSDKRFMHRTVERELSQARLRGITLREQLAALETPLSVPEDTGRAELLDLQKQTLAQLVQTEESLTDQLRRTEGQVGAVVALVAELDQILKETLIWWPSHVPVGLDWLKRVPTALLAVFKLSSWEEVNSAFLQVTLYSPVSGLFLLLLVILLWHLGQGAGEQLRLLAGKTKHRFTDNLALTFKAMGWSLLRVLPVPVLLMVMSYRLRQASGAGAGVEVLAAVLFNAAIWWLAGHLFLLFTSRFGVGTVHFGWPSSVVRRLRRNLAWYLPTQFMLVLCLALAFVHPSDQVFDVLGRAGLVAAAVFTGVLAWRLLAPDVELNRTPRQERRRALLRTAAIGYMLVLVALAFAGYLLTVSELMTRTIHTAVVLGLTWLGYRLAARALVLSEEKLRFRRMREERAKAAALESSSGGEGVEIPEQHLSMEDINQQTRTLLRVTARGVMVLALFWVWKNILPALTWLDGVTLWTRTITSGETEVVALVSLQDFLLAGVIAGLLLMAARNLPGLVEILLMRATDMDPSGRYTVSTLLRYTLIVVMVISVFSLLGLRWSELQWMVAALTLGLGFGLQEVVANFVSGLIMLFERPVRVGDTITIGEYSGTVGRIRTRATTLVDWDNREIVVPNKNFITERLINWTLTDTMTRIVLTVGVTYDADVDLVMATLQEIAEQHPLVLDDPAPTVIFLRMGDSALTFELRAYVNQLRDRLDTSSDLHRGIVRTFRERGIRIAVPQVSVNMGGNEIPHEAAGSRSALALS